mgnify:CR=1 FL=1
MPMSEALPALIAGLRAAEDRASEFLWSREQAVDMGLVSGSAVQVLPRGLGSRDRERRRRALNRVEVEGQLHVIKPGQATRGARGGGGIPLVKKEEPEEEEEGPDDDDDDGIGVVDELMRVEEEWEGGDRYGFQHHWRSLFQPPAASSSASSSSRPLSSSS